jgi:hypothetical protein
MGWKKTAVFCGIIIVLSPWRNGVRRLAADNALHGKKKVSHMGSGIGTDAPSCHQNEDIVKDGRGESVWKRYYQGQQPMDIAKHGVSARGRHHRARSGLWAKSPPRPTS